MFHSQSHTAAHANGCPVAVGWTMDRYSKMVMAGHKIVGFPDMVVFAHPSNVGAISTVRDLTAQWKSGQIYFDDVTTDDKRMARHSPHTVFPGKCVVKPRSKKPYYDFDHLPTSNISQRPPEPSPRPPKELVLLPSSLIPLFSRAIGGASHPDALSRMQRVDTKKTRSRPVHGGHRGLTTPSFVIDPLVKSAGEPSSKRPRVVLTNDRLDKYYAVEGREDESDPIEEWAEETGGRKRKLVD